MARPLRIEFANAIYHVTARGNERRDIVRDDQDRDRWLALVARAVDVYRWRMFALALMDNHFHLFLQTPEPNLSAGMQHLNGSYAGYVNARHARSGHLFQGRFKAIVVEEEGHWLELSRYVHLNPVRAGLASRPEDWAWTSYGGYHRARARLDWVDYDRILDESGTDRATARRRYRAFMEQGLGRKLDSPLSAAVHGAVLGSERFVERMRRLVAGRPGDSEVPDLKRLRQRDRPTLDVLLAMVATHFHGEPTAWPPGRRWDDLSRAVAAWVARRLTGRPAHEIARALGYRHTSGVTMACRRIDLTIAQRRLDENARALLRELKLSVY